MPSCKTSRRQGRSASAGGSFHFDPGAHRYTLNGVVLPSITQALEFCGYMDSEFYTEASRVRGSAVHALTATYDLGALDLGSCVSPYKGWLLAHIEALARWKAVTGQALVFDQVEQALYHPLRRFGGRPDRVGRSGKAHVIVDLKSGAKEPWHRLQTGLQAILVAAQPGQLPAQYWERYALYLKEDGTAKFQEHPDQADIQEAQGIIDDVCGVAA